MSPYLGVLPLVFKARKRAFSAPRIWTVEAGYLERLVREPALEMRRAPTVSPMSAFKLGATMFILSERYPARRLRYAVSSATRSAKLLTFSMSASERSLPILTLAALMMLVATLSSSSTIAAIRWTSSSDKLPLSPIARTSLAYVSLPDTILMSSGKCHP